MSHAKNTLSIQQLIVFILLLVVWTLSFLLTMAVFPMTSTITPALWYFLLSLLLLWLMIMRVTPDVLGTLALKKTQIRWIGWAILAGFGYFWLDHLLNAVVFAVDINHSIITWQHANLAYWPLSVFLSSVLLAPIFEELVFRGLLFRHLAVRFNTVSAALFSAAIFALIHWSWPGFVSLFFVGLLYAWLTQQSKSVFPAMLAHGIHNSLTYGQYSGWFSL